MNNGNILRILVLPFILLLFICCFFIYLIGFCFEEIHRNRWFIFLLVNIFIGSIFCITFGITSNGMWCYGILITLIGQLFCIREIEK